MTKGYIGFNDDSKHSVKFYRQDEIDYCMNLLRYNAKDFLELDFIKPVFRKALKTLEKIMDELMLGKVFDSFSIKITEISIESTMRVLV